MMHDAKRSSAIELVMPPIPQGRMEIDKTIEAYLPPAFVADPMRYFEEQGADIRTGEICYEKNRCFQRDPDFARLARFPALEYLLNRLKPKIGREKREISEVWKQRRLAKA